MHISKIAMMWNVIFYTRQYKRIKNEFWKSFLLSETATVLLYNFSLCVIGFDDEELVLLFRIYSNLVHAFNNFYLSKHSLNM